MEAAERKKSHPLRLINGPLSFVQGLEDHSIQKGEVIYYKFTTAFLQFRMFPTKITSR